MCELDEKKGLDVGMTYRTDKQCSNFVKAIASIERDNILNKIRQVRFISVLMDGSSDRSIQENEIVYVRTYHLGEMNHYFVGLIHVRKADTAMRTALTFESSETEEIMKKIVAFTCDGASVNTGEKNGKNALLKEHHCSKIVLVHCLVHRLELAFKKGLEKCSQYNSVVTMLNRLYVMYHTSPLQRANLDTAFESNMMKPVYPTRISGTRWLSHTRDSP